MLARPFCRDSGARSRFTFSHCSSGAMRQDVRVKVPSRLDQVSWRSLLRVTTVLCSLAGGDRTRRRMVKTSSIGADTKSSNKSLVATFEFLSIHEKKVKLWRGRLVIGIRGEIEWKERFRREMACPPRKFFGKRTVPMDLHIEA